MTLAAGSRLGPYEVLAPIGAGGMGEVYRARDTRLERTVAVKVLPQHLSASSEVRQRFEREAKTISQLSHPHICALYDVGNQDGVEYLVMEYLEGETLADRLGRGALPAEQTLRYGIQIADALDKAHRQGVVHRDLKPGNVILTKSGAKLLDFGLARFSQPSGAAFSSVSVLPTQAPDLTAEGTILGTFQYMAPEQLEGREADARTDIFAFGAVLYEMATGKKAFSGRSQASLIGAILKDEPPPISTVQSMTPPALDRVVKTCLAKDPEDRWQTARDVMLQLQGIAEGGSQAGVPAPALARRGNRERLAWIVAVLAIAAALAGAAGTILFSRRAQMALRPARASILPPEGWSFAPSCAPAVSPDGRDLAFVAVSPQRKAQLWVRPIDSLIARVLPDTDGASYPFWSPDGRFIGFFADGKLKKIESAGGASQTICEAPSGRGGSWSQDGIIVFAPRNRSVIHRVPAAGGEAQPLTQFAAGEGSHRWPFFLPDGRHFLFTALESPGSGKISVGSIDSKERKEVASAFSNAAYAAPGYLLFSREGNLLAQPFDAGSWTPRGEPLLVASQVSFLVGVAHSDFTVSDQGVILYRNSTIVPSRLSWRDRQGKELGEIGEPAYYRWPRLSPDGKRVTVLRLDPRTQQGDIWLHGTGSEPPTRLTTVVGIRGAAVWSPDGQRIAYVYRRELHTRPLDNAAADAKFGETTALPIVSDWSPDGRDLLVEDVAADNGFDLFLFPLSGEKRKPFLATQFNERSGRFSPDGRWIAYVSDESGQYEVYVRRIGGTGGPIRVSTGGGASPQWRRDGRELFFMAEDRKLMSVEIGSGAALETGKPRLLFEARAISPVTGTADYDAAPDGQRFLVNTPVSETTVSPVTLLLNWTADLKK